MSPIPLNSFRILNKKFGWQKSYEEIHQDDMDDVDLYSTELMKSDERFVDSATDTFGPWEGASEAIVLFWYRYFALVMRLHVKISYVQVGTQNRGIPNDIYLQHKESTFSLLSAIESLTLTSSRSQFIFFCHHLSEQRHKDGNKEFLEIFFDKQYKSLVTTAHSLAKERLAFFSDKNLDLDQLLKDLRDNWMSFFNEVFD
jgi:hypothetical protein